MLLRWLLQKEERASHCKGVWYRGSVICKQGSVNTNALCNPKSETVAADLQQRTLVQSAKHMREYALCAMCVIFIRHLLRERAQTAV